MDQVNPFPPGPEAPEVFERPDMLAASGGGRRAAHLSGDAAEPSRHGDDPTQLLANALASLQAQAREAESLDGVEPPAVAETTEPADAQAAVQARHDVGEAALHGEPPHGPTDAVPLSGPTVDALAAQADQVRSSELLANAPPSAGAVAEASLQNAMRPVTEGAVGFPNVASASRDAGRPDSGGDGRDGRRRDARNARWEMLRQMRDAFRAEPPAP